MSQQPITCTPKRLPARLHVAAALDAIAENPANRPMFERLQGVLPEDVVLTPGHLAVLTSKYWGNGGVKLPVAFMETTPTDLQNKLLLYMNRWNKYCNCQFVLVGSPREALVRITRQQEGYWSYLGTDLKQIPQGEPTMCFQSWSMSMPESEWLRVPPHEAGHALGFPHEHLRRQLVQRLDVQKTLSYFERTQGWSEADVRAQVLTPIEESTIRGTPSADESSIMCYQLPAEITTDGKPILGGSDIDQSDQTFAAGLYPPLVNPPPPPPPPPPGGGTRLFSLTFSRPVRKGGLVSFNTPVDIPANKYDVVTASATGSAPADAETTTGEHPEVEG